MASGSTIIDLTAESPPSSNSHPRSENAAAESSHRAPPGASRRHHENADQSPMAGRNPRPRRPPRNAVAQDDNDGEVRFVGMSDSARRARDMAANENRWRGFLGIDSEFSDFNDDQGVGRVPPRMQIHEGLHRGSRTGRTYVAPGPPYHTGLDLFASAQLAFPALNARAHRHAAAHGNNNRQTANDAGGANRFHMAWGGPNPMDYMGAILRGLQGHRDLPSKVPKKFDPKWLYLNGEPLPGYATGLIEPPVDLDTYFDDKAVVTGPLPATTPVCCSCKHALVLGANGKQRMWTLPCGHIMDGRCMSRISGVPLPPDSDAEQPEEEAEKQEGERIKGKGKAVDPPDEEPAAKSRRGRRGKARASNSNNKVETTPKKIRSKRFVCPAEGCEQQAQTGPGHDISCFELYI